MDMREYAGGGYIKYKDVVESSLREKIVAIQEGNFDSKDLKFESGSLLSLNKTNARALARAYGWESDDWIGKEIELYAGETTFDKQPQQSVLIKPISPPGAQNSTKDDDVPF